MENGAAGASMLLRFWLILNFESVLAFVLSVCAMCMHTSVCCVLERGMHTRTQTHIAIDTLACEGSNKRARESTARKNPFNLQLYFFFRSFEKTHVPRQRFRFARIVCRFRWKFINKICFTTRQHSCTTIFISTFEFYLATTDEWMNGREKKKTLSFTLTKIEQLCSSKCAKNSHHFSKLHREHVAFVNVY